MARLPAASRDTVPAGQEATFDEITQNGTAVPPYGPGSVMVHVPEASKHATGLNQYLRNASSVPLKAAELAMLVAAREMDCQHIWNAHAGSARAAGVPDAVVDAIRDNKPLPELSADESAVIHLGREILRNHQVSRGGYQSALEVFGQQGVIELTLILGNYTMLGMLINTFETDLLPERSEPLLQRIPG